MKIFFSTVSVLKKIICTLIPTVLINFSDCLQTLQSFFFQFLFLSHLGYSVLPEENQDRKESRKIASLNASNSFSVGDKNT